MLYFIKKLSEIYKEYHLLVIGFGTAVFFVLGFVYLIGYYNYFEISISSLNIGYLDFLHGIKILFFYFFFFLFGASLFYLVGVKKSALDLIKNSFGINSVDTLRSLVTILILCYGYVIFCFLYFQIGIIFLYSIYYGLVLINDVYIRLRQKKEGTKKEVVDNKKQDSNEKGSFYIMLWGILLFFIVPLYLLFYCLGFSEAKNQKEFDVMFYNGKQYILFHQDYYFVGKELIGNNFGTANYYFSKELLGGIPIQKKEIEITISNEK